MALICFIWREVTFCSLSFGFASNSFFQMPYATLPWLHHIFSWFWKAWNEQLASRTCILWLHLLLFVCPSSKHVENTAFQETTFQESSQIGPKKSSPPNLSDVLFQSKHFLFDSLPSLKLTVRTWKWMVARRSFPFGSRPIFKGVLRSF